MPAHTIEIQIDEVFENQTAWPRRTGADLLRQVALATLVHQRVNSPCDISVVVTDDETVQQLNLRHLGIDAPTDVLAFPNVSRGPFVDAPGQTRYLGDVIISFPQAEAQARDLGHDVVAEVQLLVVHGVLHLLGHDDIAPDKRALMWAAQAEILRAMGVEVGLPD